MDDNPESADEREMRLALLLEQGGKAIDTGNFDSLESIAQEAGQDRPELGRALYASLKLKKAGRYERELRELRRIFGEI